MQTDHDRAADDGMPEYDPLRPARTYEERQRRLDVFRRRVYSILEASGDKPNAALEEEIRTDIPPEARIEMLCYTNEIQVTVTGGVNVIRYGWLWRKRKFHKHMSAEIIFEPYKMTLSIWTDPKDPTKFVRFQ
jgi:hypothetical protein